MDDQNTIIAKAAQVASEVAAEAVKTAQEVVIKAADTAAKVAEVAAETQKTVMLFGNDLSYIKKDISDIKEMLETKYVTKTEFATIRGIVYGLSGTILLAFVGALVRVVIK